MYTTSSSIILLTFLFVILQITFTSREACLMECLKMISCTMGCIETIVVYEYMKLCMHVDETSVIYGLVRM